MREPNLSLRVAHTLRPVEKWVATGPDRNHIKVAAARLAGKINPDLCEREYDELIAVLLGKIRRTITLVARELQARDVFPRGSEPGQAPYKFGPQFTPTRLMLTKGVFRMHYPFQPRGDLQG